MSIKSLYEWAVTLHFIRSWTRRICSEDLHLDIDRFANTVLKWRDAAFQLRTCNCCGTHVEIWQQCDILGGGGDFNDVKNYVNYGNLQAYSILAFIVVDVIGGGELTQRSWDYAIEKSSQVAVEILCSIVGCRRTSDMYHALGCGLVQTLFSVGLFYDIGKSSQVLFIVRSW